LSTAARGVRALAGALQRWADRGEAGVVFGDVELQ
jgi:hypothetical protein